jgi:hypothetical protein
MTLAVSTRAINVTVTKKDQNWRIEIFREPGSPVQIRFQRRIQEFAPDGTPFGAAKDYTIAAVPADDARFAALLTTLDQIGDDLATARGLAGIGN